MKKLIAIAVVLALVAGVAFAVDVGGEVFGGVDLIRADSGKDANGDANPVTAGGGMYRIRLSGSGEAGEGKFGGWFRLDAVNTSINDDVVNNFGNTPGYSFDFSNGFQAIAWWKPIDQFKLSIGGNSDGIWGKEGVTGWMFNQMPYDSGIASGTGNIWGWGETVGTSLQTRFAFFHGFDNNRLFMEIKPIDMIGINIAVPFIAKDGQKAEDVFKAIVAQLDLNFDFGNIAVTYNGESHFGYGALFAYYGGSFGPLALDVGIGYHMKKDNDADDNPFYAGLGVKYAADAFGIKFRTAFAIPAKDTQNFGVLFDLLPYYAFNDNISAFLNMGIGITSPTDAQKNAGKDKAGAGWFINPYIRVGAEWGPSFYAGIKLSSTNNNDANDGKTDAVIDFSIPVSIMVSF